MRSEPCMCNDREVLTTLTLSCVYTSFLSLYSLGREVIVPVFLYVVWAVWYGGPIPFGVLYGFFLLNKHSLQRL
ncbi:hypothetical protein GGR57DRAFT_125751 [Xylariaceae sp. FL1272]|nr:hypothetical protein GGR57DRAFT_125751 [Xylariaceae sp. FL1272]